MLKHIFINQSKQKEPELRSADVKEVQRAIISQYVYIMYSSANNNLKASDVANGGDPVIYDHVVKILCEKKVITKNIGKISLTLYPQSFN